MPEVHKEVLEDSRPVVMIKLWTIHQWTVAVCMHRVLPQDMANLDQPLRHRLQTQNNLDSTRNQLPQPVNPIRPMDLELTKADILGPGPMGVMRRHPLLYRRQTPLRLLARAAAVLTQVRVRLLLEPQHPINHKLLLNHSRHPHNRMRTDTVLKMRGLILSHPRPDNKIMPTVILTVDMVVVPAAAVVGPLTVVKTPSLQQLRTALSQQHHPPPPRSTHRSSPISLNSRTSRRPHRPTNRPAMWDLRQHCQLQRRMRHTMAMEVVGPP